jgi:hypothetical protein
MHMDAYQVVAKTVKRQQKKARRWLKTQARTSFARQSPAH